MNIRISTYPNTDDGLEARIYFNHGSAFPYSVEFWDTDANEMAFSKAVKKLQVALDEGSAFCGEDYIFDVL